MAVRSYRTVGIALHEGKVLLHRSEFDDFWTLPGGSVEDMERAESALKREMREELDEEIVPERLLIVMENFFTYNGVSYQEIGLYFAMSFLPVSPVLTLTAPFYGVEKYFNNQAPFQLIFEWIALDRLSEIVIKPSVLTNLLPTLAARISPLHLTSDDTGISR